MGVLWSKINANRVILCSIEQVFLLTHRRFSFVYIDTTNSDTRVSDRGAWIECLPQGFQLVELNCWQSKVFRSSVIVWTPHRIFISADRRLITCNSGADLPIHRVI